MAEEILARTSIRVLIVDDHPLMREGLAALINDAPITEETVKVHMKRVFEKLGALDRTHAVVIALQRGIIHL